MLIAIDGYSSFVIEMAYVISSFIILFSILDIFGNVMEKVEKKIQMLASNKMAVFFKYEINAFHNDCDSFL